MDGSVGTVATATAPAEASSNGRGVLVEQVDAPPHPAARRPPTRRLRPWMVICAFLGYGGWALWLTSVSDLRPIYVSMLISVAAYVIGGLAVWWQRPDQRSGPLLLVIAACLAIPSLQETRVPALWTAGTALDSVFALVLAYAVLRFPRERLVARVDRLLAASVVVVAVVFPIALTSLVEPSSAGCPDCPPGLNVILIADRPDVVGRLLEPLFWLIAAQATIVGVRLLWKLRGLTSPALRVLAPVALPAAAWFLLHAVTRVVRLLSSTDIGSYDAVVAASTALLSIIPFGVMLGLLRARARRSKVGDLVVELHRLPTSERVRDAVARTLGDPRAEVGFWLPESRRYVTAEGDALELTSDDGERQVTYVEGRGEPLAAIVHDAALSDEPALIDAVGAAARFAVENERLHAETLARLEEVRASRARIVQAGDEERRRIERNLHDGAQQRLVALTLQLRLLAEAPGADAVRTSISGAADEVGHALVELRELAQGLHPAVLEDEGLAGAIEYLAERASVPVTVDVAAGRFGDACETAAYFVVSEALANSAKHAPGAPATVRVAEDRGRLVVEVRDTGPGGATASGGTGLRGLADRVAAVGGHLQLTSPAGGGTTVRASLPCG